MDKEIKPYIQEEDLEIFRVPETKKRRESLHKILRPKIQSLVAPILTMVERIIGIDLFWYSKISVAPQLSERGEEEMSVAYGIEPRKNEAYGRGRSTIDLKLRFEVISPDDSGVFFYINGKYEKSRFALLFHEHTEEVVNSLQNAFIYGRLKDSSVDLTSVTKVLDFLESYFTSRDEVIFLGPISVLRPKEEIHAGILLRFLTLFPLYQGVIESALQRETNFKNYLKKAMSFMR